MPPNIDECITCLPFIIFFLLEFWIQARSQTEGTLSPEGRATRCGKGQKCAEGEQPVNPRESLEIPENAGIPWNTCGNVVLGTRARLEREI